MTKIHRSAVYASTAPSSIPAMTAASPVREPMEQVTDFTTRPPSSGTTGSRLNKLTSAIQAAAAANAPLRVAKYSSPVPAASDGPGQWPGQGNGGLGPPAGEVVLGHGGRTNQRDEVDTPGSHAVVLHAPQVAALVDDEHAEDDDRELPGEQQRIRREGSQGQQQLACFDDDEDAFDQRAAQAASVLVPSQPPEDHDVAFRPPLASITRCGQSRQNLDVSVGSVHTDPLPIGD